MPVHGVDGIHVRFDAGIMTLYFLESKLAKTSKSGMSEFCKSIKDFAKNRKQYLLEYSIIADLSNLESLSSIDRDAAIEYLDIYGPKKSSRLERAVGVVCYSELLFKNKLQKSSTTTPQQHEESFSTEYAAQFEALRIQFEKALTHKGLAADAGSMWLVAVPDTDQLRELFYKGAKS